MKKEKAETDTFMGFLNEYGVLYRKYSEVWGEDSYWEQLIEDVRRQHKKYPGDFEKQLLLLLMDEFYRRERIEKEVKGKSSSVLTPQYERLLGNAYEMLDKMQTDPMLKKIYSDFNFYRLIDEIETYRNDLLTAEMLFKQGA